MASYIQNLQSAIAASEKLTEQIRGDLLQVRQAVVTARPGVLGPIEGSHAHIEAASYLSQIDNRMQQASAAGQALVERLKRMQVEARGI